MTMFQVYIDGQYFHSFHSFQDAETVRNWMGEGQTMNIVEIDSNNTN